ncbi:hypothetical protein [Mesorhizobium tianshanense]|nr:hypothetical protein [Mesorhizobium tianshanense]
MITSTALAFEKSALAGNPAATSIPPDPALALWREWETAHKLTERLCLRQQRLETRLVESVGFPCATVRLPESEEVTVHSIEALNEVLGKGPDMAALRETAEAEFAAHHARWDAAAEETGYSAVLRAEREAGERAQDLLEAFSATSATTLAGVAGKLDAVLREGEAWEECSEFPWPQIRSALSDLVRIAQQMMPEQSFTASAVQSSARGGPAAVSAPKRRGRRRDMNIRPTPLPASAEKPSTCSEASASRHPSTGRELATPDALAASHHPAASDPDLLDAFNRDAALEKWTVPEAAEAAKAFWGKTAATAIAWCAFSARCDGRTQEFRFWFRVFAHLQASSPDSEAEAASGKAHPGSSR